MKALRHICTQLTFNAVFHQNRPLSLLKNNNKALISLGRKEIRRESMSRAFRFREDQGIFQMYGIHRKIHKSPFFYLPHHLIVSQEV